MQNDMWNEDPSLTNKRKWYDLSNPLHYVLASLGLVVGIGLIWYAFHTSEPKGAVSLPLIKAVEGPHKIRPESAGAPEVPHQDITIYNRVASSNPDTSSQETTEKLLPLPEDPLHPTQAANKSSSIEEITEEQADQFIDKISQDIATAHGKEPSPSTLTESIPSHSSSKAPEQEKIDPQPHEEALAVSQPSSETSTEEPQAPSLPEVRKLKLGKGYKVQVASLPSRIQAEQEWKRLRSLHRVLLQDLTPQYVKVDLGAERGIRHRIQVGPLESKEVANSLCNSLKKQGGKCLVVAP